MSYDKEEKQIPNGWESQLWTGYKHSKCGAWGMKIIFNDTGLFWRCESCGQTESVSMPEMLKVEPDRPALDFPLCTHCKCLMPIGCGGTYSRLGPIACVLEQVRQSNNRKFDELLAEMESEDPIGMTKAREWAKKVIADFLAKTEGKKSDT